jgi:hypothetical protein
MDSQPAGKGPTTNSPENSPLPPPTKSTIEETKVSERSENKTTGQQDPTKETRREFRVFETLSLLSNAILILVGIGAVYVYNGQLGVMRDTLRVMKSSSDTNTEQVWRAISNLNWLARTMDGNLKEAQRSETESRKQARAALNASIEASRNDQRAWVGLKDPQVTLIPDKESIIKIQFSNTGKTPAISVHMVVEIKRTEDKGVICTQVFDPSIPADTKRWNCTGSQTGITITPTFAYSENMAKGNGVIMPGDITGNLGQHAPVLLTTQQYAQILTGKQRFYIAGTVWYKDVFQNSRSTDFCMVFDPRHMAMAACDTHNNAN